MYHLPAYLALARLVLARRVVVLFPTSLVGPRQLVQAGAREVLVVADGLESEEGIVVRPGTTKLPLRDRSVDVVACIEALGALPNAERRELLTEAHRILRPDGLFAGWLEYAGSSAFGEQLAGSPVLDFWTLDDELGALFEEVAMLAQMPWQGFSVAPVLDDEQSAEPELSLDERLLAQVPDASHYLAVAGKSTLPTSLSRDCVLVPLPEMSGSGAASEQLEDQIESMRDEIDRLREELSMRAAKSAAAQGRVRELESQLENLRARAGEVEAEELDRLRDALAETESRFEAAQEREEHANRRLEELEARYGELEGRHAELEAQRVELRTSLEERSRHEGDARGALEELRAQLEDERERLEEQRKRLDEQREQTDAQKQLVRSRETDLAILSRTVEDQEKALARVTEGLEERKGEVEKARQQHERLREKLEGIAAERDELRRQLDVSVAEREGARQLAARVEAELTVATRRISEQEETLAQKIEEASRLDASASAMAQRLGEQESLLTQTREKAEELSAQAAQGQMLSEVALDRDRLREELTNRQQQITTLEERLWESRESLQKEKIEGVRLSSEVDRIREQAERSRAAEKERAEELEGLAGALRALEVERAELRARLEARDDRIEQLQGEAAHLAGESEDARALTSKLQARGNEIARLKEQIAQLELRRAEATEQRERREQELRAAGERLTQLQHTVDDQAKLAATLQAEIDVKSVEVEQIAATVANLQAQIAEYRGTIAAGDQKSAGLQRQLEQSSAEQRTLRQRLREREQELDDLVSARETDTVELYKLRKELEAASSAHEQLEQALAVREKRDDGTDPSDWPDAAVNEIQRLKEDLASQARRHADELSMKEDLESARTSGDKGRLRRLQLEALVRAAEQEFMLGQLDAAEQRIWEMSDAADRNAARFEASLANLEKHKEKIEQLSDELEVNQNLLAAEQARALELERLLASERAKLARAGLGIEGFPRSDPEDDFSDLMGGDGMLDLSEDGVPQKGAFDLDSELIRLSDDSGEPVPVAGRSEPGAVSRAIDDRGSSRVGGGSWRNRQGADRAPNRARLHVEAVDDDDDDEWPEDDAS